MAPFCKDSTCERETDNPSGYCSQHRPPSAKGTAAAGKIMETPHKQVMTTYPVAIKSGQRKVHIQSPIPWHATSEIVKCPNCSDEFIMTAGFPKNRLLDEFAAHHKSQRPHPEVIPSEPVWTSIADCHCGM
jgi:hypothetical protein